VPGFQFPKKIRLAADAYEDRDNAFHLVFHAFSETAPFRGDVGDRVWATAIAERTRTAVVLLGACLMPEHLHLLAKPGDRSVIRWVNGFKSYAAKVARAHGARMPLWQPGFYDRHIRDEAEYETTLYYVLNNPVAAGLVVDSAEWPWLFVSAEGPT
jgi:REP element-mobilizing transposase RayT